SPASSSAPHLDAVLARPQQRVVELRDVPDVVHEHALEGPRSRLTRAVGPVLVKDLLLDLLGGPAVEAPLDDREGRVEGGDEILAREHVLEVIVTRARPGGIRKWRLGGSR